jgi:hypothetical protein
MLLIPLASRSCKKLDNISYFGDMCLRKACISKLKKQGLLDDMHLEAFIDFSNRRLLNKLHIFRIFCCFRQLFQSLTHEVQA